MTHERRQNNAVFLRQIGISSNGCCTTEAGSALWRPTKHASRDQRCRVQKLQPNTDHCTDLHTPLNIVSEVSRAVGVAMSSTMHFTRSISCQISFCDRTRSATDFDIAFRIIVSLASESQACAQCCASQPNNTLACLSNNCTSAEPVWSRISILHR